MMGSSGGLTTEEQKDLAAEWFDGHRYSPAPRHRRRLLLKLIEGLRIEDCLDAGCAQPHLLEHVIRTHNARGYGCDICQEVVVNDRKLLPECEFVELDLAQQSWSGGRQFDLVISSEVLEHIPDWRAALANLAKMTRKYLLISVPSGLIRPIDRMVGHNQHFDGPELKSALEEHGCKVVRLMYWGFPFHSLYRILINRTNPKQIYASFSGSYGPFQILISQVLYALFFVNNLFAKGGQLIVLAQKTDVADASTGTEGGRPVVS